MLQTETKRQILGLFLSLGIMLNLVLPNGLKPFLEAPESLNSFTLNQTNNKISNTRLPVIPVVAVSALPVINTAPLASCLGSSVTANYLQADANINLNQPANCFNLSLGKVLPVEQRLVVYSSPVLPLPKIVFNKVVSQIYPEISASWPVSLPLLPAFPIVLALALERKFRQTIQNKLGLNSPSIILTSTLSVFELNMMQC